MLRSLLRLSPPPPTLHRCAPLLRRPLCTHAPPPPPPPSGYLAFAKAFPFTNNVIIATLKTSAADLVAQTVIERKPLTEVDWRRNAVFCLFGAVYLGGFQYWYQVRVHARRRSGDGARTRLGNGEGE